MLLIFSDLHFCDGTAGDHNLPVEAYKKALGLVNIDPDNPDKTKKKLKKQGINELKVIFLGDIFDAVRSRLWFDQINNLSADLRPWGTNRQTEYDNLKSRNKFREILAQIVGPDFLKQNGVQHKLLGGIDKSRVEKVWKTCELFRGLKANLKSNDFKVEFHYVPGNHDRFMHTDQKARKIANLALSLDNKLNKYNTIYTDPEYCMVGCHGHEIDRMNCGHGNLKDREFDENLYKEPSIGEAITIEIASQLPRVAEERLKKEFPNDEMVERVVRILDNLDNVRPVMAIFNWLDFVASGEMRKIRPTLDGVVEDTLNEFAEIEFVKECSNRIDQRYIPNKILKFFLSIFDLDFHEFVRKIDTLKAAKSLLTSAVSSKKCGYDRMADLWGHRFHRKMLAPAFRDCPDNSSRYYVYGHTHVPEIVPAMGQIFKLRDWMRDEVLINTGTFRPRVYACGDEKGSQGFCEIKNMSFAAIYKDGEKGKMDKKNGRERYELWQGQLVES